MGGVAQLAVAAGHKVTGSDANVYPPMDGQLRDAGIELMEGYSAENIDYAPDLVIVGNALSRGNVEVEAVLDRGIRYISGAQWLSEYFLLDRWVVAVAGTHGKTTTSSMVAWILEYAGLKPGFLIGGVPGNFGISARAGDAPFFVVEADEYDTAFFDKRSKFVHYKPRTAVLNNLEFDHADIFDDLAAINKQFHHFVRTIPGSGKLIVNGCDENLADVLEQGCWSASELFLPSTSGLSADELILQRFDAVGGEPAQQWRYDANTNEVQSPDGACFHIEGIVGAHNLANATAAIAAARHTGVPVAVAVEAMCQFDGVKRRLERIGSVNDIDVYDDFAHHPTAIAATLSALKPKLKTGAKLIALVDFRSNSMVSGVHLEQIPASLTDASLSMLFNAQPRKLDLSPLATTDQLDAPDAPVLVFTSVQSLLERLIELVSPGDIVVCMSNGSFEGIHGQILTMLNKTAAT
jgi:UDP-N-acetylmuramate: L-alanyl-gamma-D-glutamyl-meso-diaminopimelate ligase